ncbi:MAG: CBS domain-containing protein, partial [Halobacteria archaeon]|nr:CBS domain-containing protein [Halobacteria archaeon]
MDISNIVSTEFEEVEPETRVSKLRGIFEETNIKAVIVVDKPGYQGIVTQRELISSHLNPGQKASSVMRNAPKVTKHEDVREVARLMVESNSKVLPVFEGDSLYGVITANDLLEEVNSYLNVLSVEDVYTQNLITVGTETTVGEIINKLRENAISRVPVVDEGRLEGIVTIYDIIGFTVRDESKTKGGGSESYGGLGSRQGEMKRMLDIPARDVMNSPVETTNPDEPLDNVVDRMIEMNYSSLVVVSPDTGEPIGVVTKTDILRSLTWEEEGRMDVQISNIDYLDTMS